MTNSKSLYEFSMLTSRKRWHFEFFIVLISLKAEFKQGQRVATLPKCSRMYERKKSCCLAFIFTDVCFPLHRQYGLTVVLIHPLSLT